MKLQRYRMDEDRDLEKDDKWGRFCLDEDVEALEAENAALHAECDRLTAMLTPKGTALSRFTDADGFTEDDPIERLRFFCLLAMDGQDWIDVEPFFDAVKAMLGPQKPMSAEEVTVPGFYQWRHMDGEQWTVTEVVVNEAPELRQYYFGSEENLELVGQFIGPIKMPEV